MTGTLQALEYARIIEKAGIYYICDKYKVVYAKVTDINEAIEALHRLNSYLAWRSIKENQASLEHALFNEADEDEDEADEDEL